MSYLAAHPDLVDLTKTVCATARALVRPDDELTLEVEDDPEEDDRTLQLYIRRTTYDESIGSLLSSIDDELEAHHVDAYKRISGWVGVTTDFQPPTSARAV